MDFSIPEVMVQDLERFNEFLKTALTPYLSEWYRRKVYPFEFFSEMAGAG